MVTRGVCQNTKCRLADPTPADVFLEAWSFPIISHSSLVTFKSSTCITLCLSHVKMKKKVRVGSDFSFSSSHLSLVWCKSVCGFCITTGFCPLLFRPSWAPGRQWRLCSSMWRPLGPKWSKWRRKCACKPWPIAATLSPQRRHVWPFDV